MANIFAIRSRTLLFPLDLITLDLHFVATVLSFTGIEGEEILPGFDHSVSNRPTVRIRARISRLLKQNAIRTLRAIRTSLRSRPTLGKTDDQIG